MDCCNYSKVIGDLCRLKSQAFFGLRNNGFCECEYRFAVAHQTSVDNSECNDPNDSNKLAIYETSGMTDLIKFIQYSRSKFQQDFLFIVKLQNTFQNLKTE